jgi:DNA-binding MarR family transcriptional regulator
MPAESNPQNVLADASALRRAVTRFSRRLRSARSTPGLGLSKLSILSRLHHAGPLTATDLAGYEQLQPQSLTRLLADLEQRNYISRRRDEIDRRQMLIQITPVGREILAQGARQQDTWLANAMLSSLTQAERRILSVAAELLEQLAETEQVSESS